MATTWSKSDEDSMEEECTNQDVIMCFMALDDHEDKVNSSITNDELQNVFEELFLNF